MLDYHFIIIREDFMQIKRVIFNNFQANLLVFNGIRIFGEIVLLFLFLVADVLNLNLNFRSNSINFHCFALVVYFYLFHLNLIDFPSLWSLIDKISLWDNL